MRGEEQAEKPQIPPFFGEKRGGQGTFSGSPSAAGVVSGEKGGCVQLKWVWDSNNNQKKKKIRLKRHIRRPGRQTSWDSWGGAGFLFLFCNCSSGVPCKKRDGIGVRGAAESQTARFQQGQAEIVGFSKNILS